MEALLEGFNWRKKKGEGRIWKGGNLERQNCRIGRQALGAIRGRNCDHSFGLRASCCDWLVLLTKIPGRRRPNLFLSSGAHSPFFGRPQTVLGGRFPGHLDPASEERVR